MDYTKGDLAKFKLIKSPQWFSVSYDLLYPSFDVFYLRISVVLKWKTLLSHINFPKTTLVRCYV